MEFVSGARTVPARRSTDAIARTPTSARIMDWIREGEIRLRRRFRVASSIRGLEDLPAPRGDNADLAGEHAPQPRALKETVEEHRERGDLGMGLVPDGHVERREVEHRRGDLLRPDDDQEVPAPRDAGQCI